MNPSLPTEVPALVQHNLEKAEQDNYFNHNGNVPDSLSSALCFFNTYVENQVTGGGIRDDTAPVTAPHDILVFRLGTVRLFIKKG